MKSLISFFICLLFLFPEAASAQVYTGGSTALTFMNDRTYFEASPLVGYQMGDLRAGVGAIVSYTRRNGNARTHYGGRLFSQYDLLDGLFIHGEMEALNVEYTSTSNSSNREWVFSIPVGAGYNQRISDNVYATAMILYDVIQQRNSPYDNPIIRGGIRYYL